jgi:BirA family transcriptional regulator, biotin operon repressor / biotin---[acetyl-CoA-carboxylase] ligase
MTITWLDHTGSTQDALLESASADPGRWPHLSALATLDQRSGHGRRGRSWTTPAGTALSVSVVLRPDLPTEHYSWVTLVVAAAAAGELRRRGVPARVKWPNDILVEDGRKLCGILASVLPDLSGVVLGLGLNLDFGAAGAPVDTATALAEWVTDGAVPDPAELLGALLAAVDADLQAFCTAVREHPGEVDGRHPAAATVVGALDTLGSEVTVHLPDGSRLAGTARGLGPGGVLQIEPAERGKMDEAVAGTTRRDGYLEVSAADVVHVRR